MNYAFFNTFPFDINDPKKAGQKASKVHYFGDWSRFALYAIHTRFNAVSWIIADSDKLDPLTGNPEVIVIENSALSAIQKFEEFFNTF